jgi:hypothetical protein
MDNPLPGKLVKPGQVRDPLGELAYLPMFYLFPAELLEQSEFQDFPRNPHVVFDTPHWRAVYHSDKFTETVIDGMAGMVWRHFGIKAPMEDFSGYYPFWILARTGFWLQIAAALGFNTISMALARPHFQYPVLSWGEAEGVFRQIVARFRSQYPLDEWVKAVREHPDVADYEPSRHNRRTYQDFLRKWRHSRAKWVKPVSVSTDEEWDKLDTDALINDPYEAADFRMDYEAFMDTLGEKEQHIIPLLAAGCTQAEVACQVGSANHSAVNQKVKKLGPKYGEYMKVSDTPLKERPSNNWDEMTNLLCPKVRK